MRHLTPEELAAHLAAGGQPVLLDVREPWEYHQVHLPDSRLLPMGEIMQRLDELDPGAETVVICHHGVRSQQVAHVLASRGFTRVINLKGGIDAWALTVDPAMPRY